MTVHTETIFSYEEYDKVLAESTEQMLKLGTLKGGEYAGDYDRLANFRRNGNNLDLPMEVVWVVYAGKHWDAIQQYIKDLKNNKDRKRLESIEGRIDDLLVYLILFKCMVRERNR